MTSLISNPRQNQHFLAVWQPSSWENYQVWRDRDCAERIKLYYYQH
ncbi:hypothetical protein PN466_13890 [Roseofilum reptotaenium CS-1145]|nr:hypothetical protein [Roseofilum reptotaenium]MDB9518037.1 hypothetical protein [Roseofilum reptotaenium CS-1145]